jgi:hypothetical protein
MELHLGPGDPPAEVTLDEFWELVRAGKVPPTALYRDPWTEGRWDTVNNLRSCHRKSPVKYPPGPRLAAKLAAEEERKREGERIADYERGSLIEDACGVPRLEEVAGEPGAPGAARLLILPSFEPERIVTLAFGRESIRIEAVTPGVSIWQSRVNSVYSV